VSRPLVVGIGSHHGDDIAGWLVLDQLQAIGISPQYLVRIRHPAALLDVAEPDRQLILCDACHGLGQPGSIRLWNWPTDLLISTRHCTSHDVSLPDVLQLGVRLGALPQLIAIWGIEGLNWEPGSGHSPEVSQGAVAVANRLSRNFSGA